MKRIFRIFPALFVVSLISLGVLFFLDNARLPQGSEWILARFREDRFNYIHVVLSFFGLSPFLLPQSWSVAIEIYASLLMPLLIFMPINLLVLGAVALIGYVLSGLVVFPHNFPFWTLDFFVGVILWRCRDRFSKWEVFYANRFLIALAIIWVVMGRVVFDADGLHHLMEVLISALLILFVLDNGFEYLSRPIFLKLGDWSYGLYLVHFPIMYTVAHLVSRFVVGGWALKTSILLLVTVFMSMVLSGFVYKHVELVFIEKGKRLLKARSGCGI